MTDGGALKLRTSASSERAFITAALTALDVPRADAAVVADVLVAADLRGIESHGIARLDHFYVRRLEAGVISRRAELRVIRESPTLVAFDGGNGLGHPLAKRAMEAVIEKARAHGTAWGTVRNSNHYGIAGYYAMMALPHGMIGLSMTNGLHLAATTYGCERLTGTNPIAVAVPAGVEPPFVLDMAATAVTYGRVEVYERRGLSLEPGWVVGPDGRDMLEPGAAKRVGALLPLGGSGTENGGHKGAGLAALVEILCGVLSGGAFGPALARPEDGGAGGLTGHFFGAMRVDAIRDAADFTADMDRELRMLKDSAPAPGRERVFVAGEPEHACEQRFAGGVPIDATVVATLDAMAERLRISPLERAPCDGVVASPA